jgi:hypothetical protein
MTPLACRSGISKALRADWEEFGRSCVTLVSLRPFSGLAGRVNLVKPLLDRVPPAGFEPAAFCSGGRRSIP